ncbi:hypothetical protein BBP40_001822 [Aspergillus hancockii]|nr:hypothetical protein BBP40_001822 [Aspergillus hancockii]
MSPPVRVAVQGAYLVAIIFTGATFGALSLVFKELTEGLGCLLGGFCSSMWLLSLKPGGLLTQTDAKSGFIGAISVAFYAMSFSQYTRPYGLMASTGISGGTAVALGIDCFSRAGLKEFWLYIWSLNENVFPLGTNTYPVTRNIRVELAVTVIIAILGVISQLRLWKVIRARRQKEDEIREKEKRENEEAEMENGRRFEEKNMEERLEWEAKYGNPGSGIPELADSSKKRYPADKGTADVEKGVATDTRSIASSSRELYRCSDCLERRENGEPAYAASDTSGDTGDSQTGQQEDTTVGVATEDQDQSSPHKKRVPIKVFDGAAAAQMKDDNSSDMTAIVGSEAGSTRSQQLSGRALLVKVSAGDGARLMSQSQEALVSCDGSSTQGTVDESTDSASDSHSIAVKDRVKEQDLLMSGQEGSPIASEKQEAIGKEAPELEKYIEKSIGEPSVYSRGVDENKFDAEEEKGTRQEDKEGTLIKENTGERRPSLPSNQERDVSEPKREEKSTEMPQKVETAVESTGTTEQKSNKTQTIESKLDGPAPEKQDERPVEVNQPKESSAKEKPRKHKFTSIKLKSPASESETKSKPKKEIPARLDTETVNRLPERTSRVVQSYRTNEWAKHLDDAEAPEPEPIKIVEEIEPDLSDEKKEAVAPVNVEELLQTPLNAQPPPAVERRVSLGKEPSGTNENLQMSNDTQLPHKSRSKKRAFSGRTAQSTPPVAQAELAQGTPDAHNPYDSMSPAVDSVKQPRGETEVVKPQWKGPPPLIAVREGMMQKRLSSFSLSTDPWPSRFAPGAEISSRPSSFLSPEEADNIPLSRRRMMLHHQTIPFPQPTPFCLSPANQNSATLRRFAHRFIVAFLSSTSFTTTALPVTVSPPSSRLSYRLDSSAVSETASFTAFRDPPVIPPPQAEESSFSPRGRRNPRRSLESHQPASSSAYHCNPTSPSRSIPRQKSFWTPSSILRPPAVRLANPVNYVPRITPVIVPPPFQDSDENLPLEAHRDAYPLLTIPERRRSRLTPSPNSLVVERSQGETESGRSSIAVPRGQRRSDTFNENLPLQEMPESLGNHGGQEAISIRPPDRAHLSLDLMADRANPLDDRPRHIQSQTSLRSQAQIASIPSNTGQHPGGENDVAEELAWGPAHPCYPHSNPHVSVRSQEFHTTRIIRIRRDWMVRGDLAPTFSNLYPEILDPLLPEQEFRKIIATVNDKLIKAFDPFSLRNWVDGALALLTGWLWEDIGVTGVKSQLKQVEDWLETWNREVGAKDGVYIWSLRRTAYMSLDIQIPDPKVGIIPSEGGPSLPGTRPNSGVGQ